jgi:SAM-dependent methyltransferase
MVRRVIVEKFSMSGNKGFFSPFTIVRSKLRSALANLRPEFDYEEAYRRVDLQLDYWTVVGPATRAEFEELGRGKCAQLVALGLNARSRVLDIGCGTGQLTEPLVPILTPDGLYHGVDVVSAAITFCRSRFPQSNFHFAKNEQTTIPIYDVEFDFIYLGSVFTHMFPADIALMLGEIRRLMAPGACVVTDAFVSPAIADYVGSRAMIELSEPWLLAQFQTHGFCHRELGSCVWNERCRRVIYHLTAH